VREIREELGVEIREVRLLGVIENLFTLDGQPGHEVVFVYDARFVDESLYARTTLPFHEAGWASGDARWLDLTQERDRLVPEGLMQFLPVASGCRPMAREDYEAVRAIARALPAWFTPCGQEMIAKDIQCQAGFVTCAGPDVTGFVTYYANQGRGHIGWIGVRPDRQRCGEGRRLIEQVEATLRAAGIGALEVHTLGDAVDYPPYEVTRQFYRALGFNVVQRIAHPDNPECEEELVLVKQLHALPSEVR
jgi:ribosomal protein S18 acetylase RimI-like enzyme